MKKTIMGLGGSAHDFSSVLMEENNILCGIEDERVTRKKHGLSWWYEIPCKPSADYCLEYIGKELKDMNYIVTSDIMPCRIEKYFPVSKLVRYNHHLLHAASIYYFTNVDNLAILVMDGWGSILEKDEKYRTRETISFFECNKNNINLMGRTKGEQPFEKNSFPMGISNSLGYFYNLVTKFIGFGKFEEGKTMGLVGYGEKKYFNMMMKYIDVGDTFEDIFSFAPFEYSLIDELGAIIKKCNRSFQVLADIAASAQSVFEEVLFQAVKLLLSKGYENIGFAGGCALNSVANGKISNYLSKKGKNLIVLPHVSDAGIAFGAVGYHYHKELSEKIPIKIRHNQNKKNLFNVGKPYYSEEILRAINSYYPKIEYEVAQNPSKKIANLLNQGGIVAFFHGTSEFGPRALGNRSLLANPKSTHFREMLNRNVKFREPFRPIAPIIIDKYYGEFFEGEADRPFMLKVAKVKKEKVDSIPSVVHIDGTARVQTLYNDLNPLLYKILEKFYLLSGVPILSNTSFNLKGKPIVESPKDAIETFFKMKINYLYLDGYLLKKASNHKNV